MTRTINIDLNKEKVEQITNGTNMCIIITTIDDVAPPSVEGFIRGQPKGRDVVLAYVAARDLGMERYYTWSEFRAKYPDLCSDDQYSRWQRKAVDEPKWIRLVNSMKRSISRQSGH